MFAGSPPWFAGPAFFVVRCALSGTLYRTCRRGSPGSLPPSPDGSGRLAGFARRGCFPCSRSMIARGHIAVASFCPCCLLVFFRGLCLTPCTYLVAVALPAHPRLGLRVGGFAGFACWKPFPGFMNVVRPHVSVCGCCCRLCWSFCPRALFGLNSCLLPWRPDSRPPSPSGLCRLFAGSLPWWCLPCFRWIALGALFGLCTTKSAAPWMSRRREEGMTAGPASSRRRGMSLVSLCTCILP